MFWVKELAGVSELNEFPKMHWFWCRDEEEWRRKKEEEKEKEEEEEEEEEKEPRIISTEKSEKQRKLENPFAAV